MTSYPQVARKLCGQLLVSDNRIPGTNSGDNSSRRSCAYDWGCPGPGLGVWHGGVMRIGRAFIIPAILALGVSGSALVGSAVPAVAASVPNAQVQTTGISTGTNMFHHG